jgi:hypothetical protein
MSDAEVLEELLRLNRSATAKQELPLDAEQPAEAALDDAG